LLNTTLLFFNIPHIPLTSLFAVLFVSPKETLKGWQYENIKAIQMAATKGVTAILKEAFSGFFQDLQKCWQQCIDC
jgi:hypothetical protein